jgi:hypothetical protein
MTKHASIRLGIGARVMYDGEIHIVTELLPMATGTDVVLTSATTSVRVSLVRLLDGTRAQLIPSDEGPDPADDAYSAAAIRATLAKFQAARTRRCCDCNGEIHRECRCRGQQITYRDDRRSRNAVTEPLPMSSSREVSTNPDKPPMGSSTFTVEVTR